MLSQWNSVIIDILPKQEIITLVKHLISFKRHFNKNNTKNNYITNVA